MSTSNNNAQKLYILGSGQIIHVCIPNASITENKGLKIQKKMFSKIKTIASKIETLSIIYFSMNTKE